MMCYKDRTFCASDCKNTDCLRFFGDKEQADAEAWWGSKEAPVAFSDFSANCPNYLPENKGSPESVKNAVKSLATKGNT